jgi:hypothetical protein
MNPIGTISFPVLGSTPGTKKKSFEVYLEQQGK